MLKPVTFAIILLTVFGCQKKQKIIEKVSYMHEGEVFMPMALPSPNSIRNGAGSPGHEYWQQRADHDIKVTLDTQKQFVTASEVITYTNNSPDTLREIWLQLEQNIHREDSVRVRESGSLGQDDFEGIKINNLKADGIRVDWHDYATLAMVQLNKPLNPNESVTLSLDWTFPFPTINGIRMGYDDAYEAGAVWEFAQWFPTPCVYDDVYGWNNLPYIGRGEFYTNFGDYSVEVTVPRDHIVVSSGVLQNPEEVLTKTQHERLQEAMTSDEFVQIRNSEEVEKDDSRPEGDGMLTWKFKTNDIRTFAFATSASFKWDATSVAIQDLDGSTRRILCMACYPEEVTSYWHDAADMVKHSIRYYSESLYPYPWEQMTVVRGIEGGMEYPLLVFCRGRDSQGLFNVTDHEVGHDWFPMLVNTDERRHAWLDEGLNSFVNHYSLESYYGEKVHRPDVPKYRAERYKDDLKAINTPPDLLYSRGHLSYRKPAYGLRLLREEIIGPERFDIAFKEYVRRWAFKSPRPADFYRTMEDMSGMDLQWFFKGFFESTMQLDQAVIAVKQKNVNDEWSATITLENKADWVCPVALTITCEDGSVWSKDIPVTLWAWSTRRDVEYIFPSRITEVEIDSREVFPDINRTNNHFILH